MILEEFDWEKQIRLEKKESYAEGHMEGHMEGLTEGRNAITALARRLLADSRIDDLKQATENPKYLEQLLQEYNIS